MLPETYRAGTDVPADFPRGFPVPGPMAPAPPGRPREDVRSAAHEHGLAVLYAPSMRNGTVSRVPEDRGNAILSTVGLADALVIELPLERQRRVAASAKVAGRTRDGAVWQLRIANVHLDTAVFTRGGPFRARRRQAEAVIDALGAAPAIPNTRRRRLQHEDGRRGARGCSHASGVSRASRDRRSTSDVDGSARSPRAARLRLRPRRQGHRRAAPAGAFRI